ncbi:MAG: Hsp20/alpha crystallin family protein [Spirochaetales bacterium]|nr:Hsp20/alpha crystallin family protein [Spirochaetales bacterium]
MRDKCLANHDIYVDKEKVELTLEMPGINKDNLDIKIDKDTLIIDAKRGIKEATGEYRIREIDDRDYHHEFTIDDTIDRDKVDAVANNGVVTITLGIKESKKPRKIEVIGK